MSSSSSSAETRTADSQRPPSADPERMPPVEEGEGRQPLPLPDPRSAAEEASEAALPTSSQLLMESVETQRLWTPAGAAEGAGGDAATGVAAGPPGANGGVGGAAGVATATATPGPACG